MAYASNGHEGLYIGTSTGVFSKRVRDGDQYEGYSFALLHKHHYMDFSEKMARDVSTLVGAGLQVAMVIIGLLLYLRHRKRQRMKAA